MTDLLPMDEGNGPLSTSALRELAERLLDYGMAAEPARLLVGALAPGFPPDIPLPGNSRLLGSLTQGSGEIAVVFEAPGSAEDVFAFYHAALTGAGWTVQEPELPGGFRPSGSTVSRWTHFCQSPRGPALGVGLAQSATGPTRVRLTLQPPSRHNPCAHQHTRGRYPIHDHFPDLTPPPGARQMPQGGGGSDRSWHSEALLETNLDPEVVVAHFAPQLVAQGWRQTDVGQGATAAWSAWELRGEGDERWQGLLFALLRRATPREYLLHLRLDDIADAE